MKDILYVLRFIKPYRGYLILLILILALSSLLNVIHPYLTFSVIIDSLLPFNDFPMIAIVAVVIIVIVVILALIQLIQGYIMSYIGARVAFDIRHSLMQHVINLSLKFFSERNSGTILERLNRDVMGIQELLVDQMVNLITNFIQIFFLTIAIFMVNAQLALFIVIMVLIQTIIVIVGVKKLHWRVKDQRKQESELMGALQERISLIRLIQVFGRQNYEEDLHSNKSRSIIGQMMNIASSRSQFMTLFFFFMNIIPLGVLWYGSFLIVSGKFQVGGLLTMMSYANSFLRPIITIIMGINLLQERVVGIQRVKEYFDEEPLISNSEDALRIDHLKGNIEFKNVDFSYEEGKSILHGINLTINKGETVAFVGESGSGKSTLTNLLLRLYDIQKGSLLIDNREVREYDVYSLRRQIGVVFQETDLFAVSLRENLTYGAARSVSDEEIMDAVEQTLLDDLVARLPQGLDTVVEERGSNFSGGEKQRIAICRLLLKRPSILIFDEATSALDTKSEKMIQATMEKIMSGPTSILIAHRLSTIVDADRIFVLHKGRIVEKGTHKELLKKGGEYVRLWDEQLKKERYHVGQ